MDATNEIRKTIDEDVIAKTNKVEALAIMADWKRENADMLIAKEISEKFEKEMKLERNLESSKGESEALRIAVEESKRIKLEAQAKEMRERNDASYVERLLLEEKRLLDEAKKREEEDLELARKVDMFGSPALKMTNRESNRESK